MFLINYTSISHIRAIHIFNREEWKTFRLTLTLRSESISSVSTSHYVRCLGKWFSLASSPNCYMEPCFYVMHVITNYVTFRKKVSWYISKTCAGIWAQRTEKLRRVRIQKQADGPNYLWQDCRKSNVSLPFFHVWDDFEKNY